MQPTGSFGFAQLLLAGAGHILYKPGSDAILSLVVRLGRRHLHLRPAVPFIASLGYSQTVPMTVAPGQLVTLFVNGANTKLTAPVRALNSTANYPRWRIMVPGSQTRIYPTPLPCSPVVTHADGSPVSATKPAKSGEELVAYAVGLGQTNPPLTIGQTATSAAPTIAAFGIDFLYSANSLGTQSVGPSFFGTGDGFPMPTFTGATPGFVGLYQVNFIVPPPPAGLAPCIDSTEIIPFSNAVQSNRGVRVFV